MWKTISSILGKTETGNDSEASGLTEQNLMDFFNKKIESVRQTVRPSLTNVRCVVSDMKMSDSVRDLDIFIRS